MDTFGPHFAWNFGLLSVWFFSRFPPSIAGHGQQRGQQEQHRRQRGGLQSCLLYTSYRHRKLSAGKLLSLPLPAPSKLHSNRVDPQTFTLPNLPSLPFAFSTASALSSFLRLLRLLFDGLPFSDQALDRLVSPSFTPHSASTDDLSTSSSLRGLTCFKQWQSSSSGGLHA